MSWHTDRAAMREDVHGKFSRAARYFAPGSASYVVCSVRRHDNQARFGDLDRDGYAQVVEEVQRCVFDVTEVPSPEEKGRVHFTEDGFVYRIATVLPADDARYITCELVRVLA